MLTKIRKIVTRYPNLEVGFFAALLNFYVVARRQLGITEGRLEWEFVPSGKLSGVCEGKGAEELRKEGTLVFNTGGGSFDQHGLATNGDLGKTCSMDLIREVYNFLNQRPYLKKIFEKVRENDISGTRISGHPYNLREIMTGLTVKYPDDPQTVLDFLSLAFSGIFQLQKKQTGGDLFTPDKLRDGVSNYAPEQLRGFSELVDEGIRRLQQEWKQAQVDLRRGYAKQVTVQGIPVRVISLNSNSVAAARVARDAGYGLVVVRNSDNHVQISSSTLHGDNIKLRFDLGAVAEELRRFEAGLNGWPIAPDVDLRSSGMILITNGQRCPLEIPWYLAEFRTFLANGTLSNKKVPPTRIRPTKLLDLVCKAIPVCRHIIYDKEKKEWRHKQGGE